MKFGVSLKKITHGFWDVVKLLTKFCKDNDLFSLATDGHGQKVKKFSGKIQS